MSQLHLFEIQSGGPSGMPDRSKSRTGADVIEAGAWPVNPTEDDEEYATGDEPVGLKEYGTYSRIEKSDIMDFLKAHTPHHERVASAAKDVDRAPTEGQKKAGNYRKGHVNMHGIRIAIENPKGSYRSGVSPDGKGWRTQLAHHYGYIKRTTGADGDHVDVFIGPHPRSEIVFVVNQTKQDGSFDEHKCMLGFFTEKEARAGYLANYESGWNGLGSISPMTMSHFRSWLDRQAPDRLPGGLGDNRPDSSFDPAALAKGIRVELEHTYDPGIAAEIAKDHLTEDPDYYDKLEKIEKAGPEPFENIIEFVKARRASIGEIHHWASGDWQRDVHGWSKIRGDIKAHLEKLNIQHTKRTVPIDMHVGLSSAGRMYERREQIKRNAEDKEKKNLLPETEAALSRMKMDGKKTRIEQYTEQLVDTLAGKYRDHLMKSIPASSAMAEKFREKASVLREAADLQKGPEWEKALNDIRVTMPKEESVLVDEEDVWDELNSSADEFDDQADAIDEEINQHEYDVEEKIDEYRSDLEEKIEELNEKAGKHAERYLKDYLEKAEAVSDRYPVNWMDVFDPLKTARIQRANLSERRRKLFKRITRNVQKSGFASVFGSIYEFIKAKRRQGEYKIQSHGSQRNISGNEQEMKCQP